jgi:hypothetical protein
MLSSKYIGRCGNGRVTEGVEIVFPQAGSTGRHYAVFWKLLPAGQEGTCETADREMAGTGQVALGSVLRSIAGFQVHFPPPTQILPRCPGSILSATSGLEQGPRSFVSTIEELRGRKGSSSLEFREYGRKDPLRWPRNSWHQLLRQEAVSRSI